MVGRLSRGDGPWTSTRPCRKGWACNPPLPSLDTGRGRWTSGWRRLCPRRISSCDCFPRVPGPACSSRYRSASSRRCSRCTGTPPRTRGPGAASRSFAARRALNSSRGLRYPPWRRPRAGRWPPTGNFNWVLENIGVAPCPEYVLHRMHQERRGDAPVAR